MTNRKKSHIDNLFGMDANAPKSKPRQNTLTHVEYHAEPSEATKGPTGPKKPTPVPAADAKESTPAPAPATPSAEPKTTAYFDAKKAPTPTPDTDKTATDTPKAEPKQSTKEPDLTPKDKTSTSLAVAPRKTGVAHKAGRVLSLALGLLSMGLVGYDYVRKAQMYADAQYAAAYNAQLAELQREAVESIHQSALEALKTGNPLFDQNNGNLFPNMNGKFDEFAAANPELADKITSRIMEQNPDVLNSYAAERGFEDWDAFLNWSTQSFAHLFNADGTIAAGATMQQIDQYYYCFADLYNYMGDEALHYYAEDLLQAGIDSSVLEGIEIIPTPIYDDAGNIINTIWQTQISPDAITATATGWDATQIVGAAAVTVLAGAGVYLLSDKIISRVSKDSGEPTTAEPVEAEQTR